MDTPSRVLNLVLPHLATSHTQHWSPKDGKRQPGPHKTHHNIIGLLPFPTQNISQSTCKKPASVPSMPSTEKHRGINPAWHSWQAASYFSDSAFRCSSLKLMSCLIMRVGLLYWNFLLMIITIMYHCDNCNYCHIWYRSKICCEVTPELCAFSYYGPWIRHSYAPTAQFAVRN